MVSCKEPEARRPKQQGTTDFYKEILAKNKKLNALEQQKLAYWISKDTLNTYITSADGFWYTYNKKDSLQTVTPKLKDVVTLLYDVKSINGSIIYETQQRNYVVDKEDFIPALQDGIKLENTIFTFYRMAIVCLLICFGLLVESFYFIESDVKTANREIKKLIKSSDLNLTKKQEAYLRKKPERLNKIIKQKNKAVQVDLDILSNVPKGSALQNLQIITSAIKRNQEVALTKYTGDLEVSYAEFKSKSERDSKQLTKVLKALNVRNLKVDDSKKEIITVKFEAK